jgi:rubrerythrin
MRDTLNKTLAYLFTAATVAGIRNRLHAKKAVRAGKPVLAELLAALASSESAHIRRFAMYLRGKTSGSDAFLAAYRKSKLEELVPLYAAMAAQYKEEGETGKAENLRQFAQVLAAQAEMIAHYQSESEAMAPDVYVCQICGFVTTTKPTANCPVCNAVREKFDHFGR